MPKWGVGKMRQVRGDSRNLHLEKIEMDKRIWKRQLGPGSEVICLKRNKNLIVENVQPRIGGMHGNSNRGLCGNYSAPDYVISTVSILLFNI